MASTRKKNMANRTRVCSLEIRIEETLILLKARGVITENTLLLKHQKQAITVALNGEDALMLLRTALRKSWIYQALPFFVSQDTSLIWNKIPGREFYWSDDHELSFIQGWESKIVNQPGLQTDPSKIDVISQY